MHILVGTNMKKQKEMLQLYYATGLTREKGKQICNCRLLPCSILFTELLSNHCCGKLKHVGGIWARYEDKAI